MIDKKPAVGRILFRTSVRMHGHFQRYGTIVKVNPKSVAYARAGWGKPRLLYLYSIAAVCDTEDEAAALEAFDKRARHVVNDTIRRFQFEAQVLTNSVPKG